MPMAMAGYRGDRRTRLKGSTVRRAVATQRARRMRTHTNDLVLDIPVVYNAICWSEKAVVAFLRGHVFNRGTPSRFTGERVSSQDWRSHVNIFERYRAGLYTVS
jgi:hypothetical protein